MISSVNILKYLHDRGISGGQALIARNLLQAGYTDQQTDHHLYNMFKSEEAGAQLYQEADRAIAGLEWLHKGVRDSGVTLSIDQLKYLENREARARFLRQGLRQEFPQMGERRG